MKTARSTYVAALVVASLTILVTSCGEGELAPDDSAKAHLDIDRLQIVLPLDEYVASEQDEGITSKAGQEILRECLQTKGHPGMPPVTVSSEQGADRFYGLWNAARAAEVGYGVSQLPSPAAPATPGGWSEETDAGFAEAFDACREATSAERSAVTLPEPLGTTAEDIRQKALELAQGSPEWSAARQQWKECITAGGLTPRAEDSAWSSQQGYDILVQLTEGHATDELKREEIRVAVIEAACNDETGLTQTLGDLEAGYQVALIKGNESVLAEEKAKNQQHIDAAHEYLANHQ